MNNGGRERFPFTALQWEELEQQALIFKYIISGIPVPPHLLHFPFKPTLPNNRDWSCLQMGLARRFDPEPGRCRRTDGKKWRCSKQAFPDSKYCDKHMHRGKNRSRKPTLQLPQQQHHFLRRFPSSAPPLQQNMEFLPRCEEHCNYRNGKYVEDEERLQFAPMTLKRMEKIEGGEEEKGRTHCFLEEWQWKSRKGVEDAASSSSSSSSTSMTQLSISIV